MPTPFSQTLRALDFDKSPAALLSMTFALVLTLAWFYWFFFAELTFFETGQILHVDPEETVIGKFISSNGVSREKLFLQRKITVVFRPEAAPYITVNQPALIDLNHKTLPERNIPLVNAHVTEVEPSVEKHSVTVHLLTSVDTDTTPNPFNLSHTGSVTLETQRATPAEWVLRALPAHVYGHPTPFASQ